MNIIDPPEGSNSDIYYDGMTWRQEKKREDFKINVKVEQKY